MKGWEGPGNSAGPLRLRLLFLFIVDDFDFSFLDVILIVLALTLALILTLTMTLRLFMSLSVRLFCLRALLALSSACSFCHCFTDMLHMGFKLLLC